MIKVVSLFLTMLLALFVTSLAPVQAVNNLADYSNYLNSLSKTTPESAIKARDRLVGTFANESQQNRNAAFLKYHSFYFKLLETLNEKEINLPESKEKATAQYYKNNGFSLRTTEGIYFLGPSYAFLDTSFSKYLSPDFKEYLLYRSKIDREGYLEDAGLVIPWDKLRERISFIENFLNKYPSFPLKSLLESNLSDYIRVYLIGVDNSMIETDYDNPKLSPVVKSSYEKFLSFNKNSRYYPLVSQFYNLLKQNNFVVTDAITQTISKKLPEFPGEDEYGVYGFEVK